MLAPIYRMLWKEHRYMFRSLIISTGDNHIFSSPSWSRSKILAGYLRDCQFEASKEARNRSRSLIAETASVAPGYPLSFPEYWFPDSRLQPDDRRDEQIANLNLDFRLANLRTVMVSNSSRYAILLRHCKTGHISMLNTDQRMTSSQYKPNEAIQIAKEEWDNSEDLQYLNFIEEECRHLFHLSLRNLTPIPDWNFSNSTTSTDDLFAALLRSEYTPIDENVPNQSNWYTF